MKSVLKATAAALVVSLGTAMAAVAQQEDVVIRPAEIQDVLVNPDMGIETFQRFNGDAINPLYTWSERGPETLLQAAPTKPDFPDSSIAYLRWYWDTLEPEHGHYRWDIIDLALAEAQKHGQRLAIRLMPYSDCTPRVIQTQTRCDQLPEWYRNSGAIRANKPTDKDGMIWQPDFGDPLYLKYWGEFVAAAGKRYDGNPILDSVDIASVGYWGEGWSPYMPGFKDQSPLIDIWLEAFPHTTLLMNFDEPEALAYGTQHGTGWRLDCWGDMNMKNHSPEMLDQYPQEVVTTGIGDVWKRSPVSLEVCGTPSSWLRGGYDVNYILAQALRWHVTSVNLKSSPIPQQWKPEFEQFEKRMGYRLILRRLEYSRQVAPGAMMPIHMWWYNAGVAPVYRNYRLAMQLWSPGAKTVFYIPADVRKWLPGDSVVDEPVNIPLDLPSGSYHVRIALVDPDTGAPAIRLAIAGRTSDGWYDLGTLDVQKQ
jgi:hypothetical protein